MIPGGFSEQVFDGRRHVVNGRPVTPDDVLAIDALESWLQFQPRDAVQVDGDQVQASRGHMKGQPLDGLAITAASSDAFRPASDRP